MSQSSDNLNLAVDVAVISDIGMRRLNNQDAHIELIQDDETVWLNRGHLFAVADGMGAHAAGELASEMAVNSISHHYCQHRQLSPPEAILKAVHEANSEIHQRGQLNTEFHNMGTTCSSLLILPQGALVAHVGDSRIYRLRANQLQQLTFDHSLVWEVRATGKIRDSEAAINIPKNVITRSLGPQPNVQVDLEGPFEIQEHDVFLICSDGLTGKVSDQELGLILNLLPPQEAVSLLVDLANVRGGPDNITATVIKITGPGAVTRHRRSEPLVVGADMTPPPEVHVGVWVAMAICWLVAAGLAVSGYYLLALLLFLGGATAIPFALWPRGGKQGGVPLTGGRRLGRGPYVTVDCAITKDSAEQLRQSVVQSLRLYRDATLANHSRVEACLTEAKERIEQGKFQEAFRMLAVAVNAFADAIRRPNEKE